jgi:hypothetical protein
MACTENAKLALFAAYVASIVAALANPANLEYERAYLMAQGANIVTLLLVAYCKSAGTSGGSGPMVDLTLAAGLGVAFAMRATDRWRGGSRWDSMLVVLGTLLVMQRAFDVVLPGAVRHRALLYIGFSCLVLPVLSALPHLVRMPAADRELMRRAVGFARRAYSISGKGEVGPAAPLWTLVDEATDTRAGVSRVIDDRGRTELFVYFAGTGTLENWKTNVDILGDEVPAEWGCGATETMRTHKGYTKAFQSVATKMLTALEAELGRVGATDDFRLVFCGHSLGGALATMAALYACCKLPRARPNVTVITFGSPQVGDGNFVRVFDRVVPASVRVVNPMDFVPRLLQSQFVHVKGYYPVGSLTLDNTFKAHNLTTYAEAVDKPRALSVLASFAPAVVAALVIAAYVTWQLA